MGPDVMILVFWMLILFKLTFSLFSFTFIKRLFSSSSLSAVRVVSSTYWRLLIFLLAFLISACASSSLVFHMMYSAYKLHMQGDNIQPWHTAVQICNQSILKEISPEYSLEGLMLKLKLQHFGQLMQRADSLEKTLMLGGIGGRREGDDRGWDGWMASPTQWTQVWVNSGSWWWTGRPSVLWFMGSQRVRHD